MAFHHIVSFFLQSVWLVVWIWEEAKGKVAKVKVVKDNKVVGKEDKVVKVVKVVVKVLKNV